jgi:hypothetical protein
VRALRMDHNPHNLAYMDLQTFLTIFLSCVFGLGIAIALYAMSIVTIDPRLARWGAYGAWLSLILLCLEARTICKECGATVSPPA